MVDREARDKLAAIIESYLDERITAFAFDEQITEVAGRTKDETVRHASATLWYHYDDCKDHNVVLSKEQWNYFQRLLLLLRSDATVGVQCRRVWSWQQAVAALLLAGFAAVVQSVGWGEHLFVYALPFGIISIVLSLSNRRAPDEHDKHLAALVPFGRLAELFEVHRSVPSFVKRPYPRVLTERTIRSPFMAGVLTFQFYAIWTLFAPVALFFQLLPKTEGQNNVRLHPSRPS